MNLIRLFAIAKKEFKHILRDPKTLASAFFIPIFLIFLFCDSLSLDVNDISLAILDLDNSIQSKYLIDKLQAGGYFRATRFCKNYAEVQKALNSGEAEISIVIPAKFGSDLIKHKGNLQILADGVNPSRTTAGTSYMTLILRDFFTELLTNSGQTLGISSVNHVIRVWYNPSLESRKAIVPGLIALIMAILSALLTSTTISKEWESSSMELLLSTPVSKLEIIFGKFFPYFIIGYIDTTILICIARFLYNIPIKGNIFLLALVCIFFLGGVLFQGLTISVVTKNSLVSNILALLSSFLPTMILSGFVFYIRGMPEIIQYISCIVPAKYFINCARGIYSKASNFDVLFYDILFLFAFNVFFVLVAFVKFRKKID
ncbi:ABC transporter permease [bacterium]|nr:ABC transporter permease [bacterium]